MRSLTRDGSFVDEHTNGVEVAQAGSRGQRVRQMEVGGIRIVGAAENGGDATLGPSSGRLVQLPLGDDTDAEPVRAGSTYRSREPRHATSDDEQVKCCHGSYCTFEYDSRWTESGLQRSPIVHRADRCRRVVGGNDQIGGEIEQWNHDEVALVGSGMWDGEVRIVRGVAVDPDHIHIERSRSPPDRPCAPSTPFEFVTLRQQPLWGPDRQHLDDNVQELILSGTPDRFALVDRTHRNDVVERTDRLPQILPTIAEIRTQGQERPGCRGRFAQRCSRRRRTPVL